MIAQAIDTIPGLWDVSAVQYHEDTEWVSHSSLEVFRASVPLYHGRYVACTLAPDAPTPAMQLGSALHAFVLEPGRFDQLVAVAPDVNRRTKDGKRAWESLVGSATCRLLITADQYAQVKLMADGIAQNPLAVQLLTAHGRTEQSVRWIDGETGVRLKCRFDRLLDVGIAVDLKTSSDPTPSAWPRTAAAYAYHRQTALYRAGRQEVFGQDGEFLHIVVGTQPPYECVVYELCPESIALGRRQNAEALARLARCRAQQCWDSAWAGEVLDLDETEWGERIPLERLAYLLERLRTLTTLAVVEEFDG